MQLWCNLNKTVFIFCIILFANIVGAENSDRLNSIQVQPLPLSKTTLTTAKPAVTLPVNPQTRKIANRIIEKLNNFKHQSSTRSLAVKSPRSIKKVGRKSSQNFKMSSRADGSIRQMSGGILESPAASRNTRSGKQRNNLTARQFLRSHSHMLGVKAPDKELYLINQHSDQLGRDHLKFGQRYLGLLVWPSDIIVHIAPEGHVDLMNGAYAPTPRKRLSLSPKITQEQAKTNALNTLKISKATFKESPELIFYYEQQTHKLAWKMKVHVNMRARWLVIVDAISGDILLKNNEIMGVAVSGSGFDLLNQNQSLQIFEDRGDFVLVDTSKQMFDPTSNPPDPNATRGAIFLYDAQNQDIDLNPLLSLVNSSQANRGFLADGVSAAFNISQVYDYFLERHNRNSIDNRGGSLFGIVRVGDNFDNAFWDGQRMFFGDGDKYAAALDVVAHEVSHGVTQRTANLIYQNQPGALNEAFSDIFGEMVEARTFGRNDWIIGTELSSDLRNLRDPSSLFIGGTNIPYPSKMSEFIRFESRIPNEDNDFGGVHLNSSIINHAYYMLAEGLNNAIGLQDAEQIFYRALTVHLVRNSQFIDARLAAISSANELFGENSPQTQKTAEAFDFVEIFEDLPSTPPPSSIASVEGADATLFVCRNNDLSTNFLCRRDSSLGDPDQGVFLSRFDIISHRPSVSGDGEFATFVDSVNDVCFISTDGNIAESCAGLPGTVSSVALSPDGNVFGFVILGDNNQPENFITITDFRDDAANSRTFKLVAPAIDASSINNIAFADVMNFTSDNRFIIYDALTEFNLLDGTVVNNWNIYALEIETGQTSVLVSASPGIDISNPSLSQTSDNFMTFSLSESEGDSSDIISANLNTGDVQRIGVAAGIFSVPGYNGDDSAVIFDQRDRTTATGFSIFSQAIANDHITATGALNILLADAAYGVIFRRGEYTGPIDENGFYDLINEILRIHAVDVLDNAGRIITYEADLNLVTTQPIMLRLMTANETNEQRPGGNAVYDPATGKVSIPRVSITDANSNTQVFNVEMKLVSNAFDFEVTKLEAVR